MAKCIRLISFKPLVSSRAKVLNIAPLPNGGRAWRTQAGLRAPLRRSLLAGVTNGYSSHPGAKGRLHKVVAKNIATEGRLTRQGGQAAGFHKGFNANNGVMAPVVGSVGLPKARPVASMGL